MLAKKYRLSKSQIERLYKRGKSFREDFLLVRFVCNNIDHGRFAVIVPKVVAAKASDRNRLKRKTFALIEKIKPLRNIDIGLTFKAKVEEAKIEPALLKILARMS